MSLGTRIKAFFGSGRRPAPEADAGPTGAPDQQPKSRPQPPTPSPPVSAVTQPVGILIAGPFQTLHAVIEQFEHEVRGPQWVSCPDVSPLRCDRLRAELGDTAAVRLRRLRVAVEADDPGQLETWVKVDLTPYLEQLCGHFSDAAEAVFRGNAAAHPLHDRLSGLLLTEVSDAASRAGLFTVQPVTPFVTEFNPEIHHAAGGLDASGAEGRIVRLVAIGQFDATGRKLLVPARVIVGK